jgi:hypothetical protein
LWLVKVGSRSGGLVFAGRYAEAGVTPTNTVSITNSFALSSSAGLKSRRCPHI